MIKSALDNESFLAKENKISNEIKVQFFGKMRVMFYLSRYKRKHDISKNSQRGDFTHGLSKIKLFFKIKLKIHEKKFWFMALSYGKNALF